MSTTAALPHRPPSHPAEHELELDQDLMGLLELLGSDDDETGVAPRPSLRRSGARLLSWAQDSSRRAAAWGAVPAVSTRSTAGIEGAP